MVTSLGLMARHQLFEALTEEFPGGIPDPSEVLSMRDNAIELAAIMKLLTTKERRRLIAVFIRGAKVPERKVSAVEKAVANLLQLAKSRGLELSMVTIPVLLGMIY